MEQLRVTTFDEALERSADQLTCVFFWGHDCPNCDVAKRSLVNHLEEVKELALNWFHVNVYEDSELGTRFGLHGIPIFIFFHKGKRLGKISPFPGIEPFLQAIHKLKSSAI